MAILWTTPKAGENVVGQIRVTITVTNHVDQIRAESGSIAADLVRTVTLDQVLVDTGATLLGLPADMIAQLGLPVRREVIARTAGRRRTRRFSDAELTVYGRGGTFDCIELQAGSTCLLGVTILGRLGLQPDVQNHVLRLLPEGPDETYILE